MKMPLGRLFSCRKATEDSQGIGELTIIIVIIALIAIGVMVVRIMGIFK